MKLLSVFAALCGLTLLAALVTHFGLGSVIGSLIAFGWTGFVAISGIHLVLIAVMGIAWAVLLPGTRARVPIWGRLVRDSGCELLPLSQIGGYVLGVRAVTITGVPGASATASTAVDVTLEFFAQLVYTALAACWLFYRRPQTAVLAPVAIGLSVAAILAAAFVAVQRRGFDLLGRAGQMLRRSWADKAAAGASALHAAFDDIYRWRARIWISFLLHLACWIASTCEAWVALRLAGVPLGFLAVLVIESLLYAARSVAFAVPNAVGVQEGAYILLGANFGLAPETALALSFLKRARDITIGLPVLAVWQLLESGRLWRRAASARTPPDLKRKPRP
ncbi:MAG: flippase-like domain-containing protein [Alphaproteobacteria bacterium]|nr:flippase-like domain-containing protein [Alphaproteobacteria bacterium]